MPRKSQKLKSVSINKILLLEIDKFNEANPELAFRSRADFVTIAIREKLERHGWEKFAVKN